MEVIADERVVLVPNKEHSFSLSKGRAAYVKGDNTLHVFNCNDDLILPGMRSVHVDRHLGDMLLKRALSQLHEYVASNLRNMEMYRQDNFWKDALRYAGRIIIPGEVYVLSTRAEQGILNVYVSGPEHYGCRCRCNYDFIEKRMYLDYISWQMAEQGLPPQNFMGYVFGGTERFILAQRQYDEGLIPTPYMELYLEISRINRFLEGRRTVNALFGENKKLLCYPRKLQTAAFLIKLQGGRFTNNDYNFRREIDENIVSLDELDGLPRKLIHRSDELEIDTDVFEGVELIGSVSGNWNTAHVSI